MSSGTYFPPPVKAVEIPKKNGGIRVLGIPTVADRIAQMVVKLNLEPYRQVLNAVRKGSVNNFVYPSAVIKN